MNEKKIFEMLVNLEERIKKLEEMKSPFEIKNVECDKCKGTGKVKG
jgi:hypothetical protein